MKAERPVSRLVPAPDSGRNPMLRFLGVFVALVAAYYALTLSVWVDANVLFPVMKLSAWGASALLNLAGVKTTCDGVVVRGTGYAVAVRRGCDPLEPIVLFAAGVIAFPVAWRRKLQGLILGGTLLFGLNLVRLASLYLLGARRSPLHDSFHLVWWPAFFIFCSLALWVLWVLWTRPPKASPNAPNSGAPNPAKPLAARVHTASRGARA